MNVTRGEILDLTFSTSNVRNNITNWKILDKVMFSDLKTSRQLTKIVAQ